MRDAPAWTSQLDPSTDAAHFEAVLSGLIGAQLAYAIAIGAPVERLKTLLDEVLVDAERSIREATLKVADPFDVLTKAGDQ